MRAQFSFLLAIGASGLACAGSVGGGHQSTSAAVHAAAAERHEQAALAHEQMVAQVENNPATYSCGDEVLNEQMTSGTEQLTSWMPCWDLTEETEIRHRAAARRERALAQRSRDNVAALLRAEEAYCRGIHPRELGHSPFAHRKAIAEVIPHRQSGEIRGARIVFKPVPGLTAAYMVRAIECNQARRAVLGIEVPDDPSLVPGAEVTVAERSGHLEVLVRLPSQVDGAIALARAQELRRAQTATRD
jgi:hypothetical protein